MAKLIKKKFFEIEIPLMNEKYESLANSIGELDNKKIKIDATRKLKGKSVDITFTIKVENNKATAIAKSMTLMPFFIKHMLHTGIDYVEDSFTAETLESQVVIKPFFITRKKVSRAVRRTLRNSAKNWLIDYLKTKGDEEVFQEILSNQVQKPLSLRLKKIYPLAICEIKVFEIKKHLANPAPKVIKQEVVEEKTQIEEIEEELRKKEEAKNTAEEAEVKDKKKTKDKKDN